MKSHRQERAETLAARFRVSGRKPIVLEFAGVPKAGKTSTLAQLQIFLKRCGFGVEVVVERASVCPIRDKKHANFNVWTACTTLAQILEKTQVPPRPEDPDILILDRGLFDSICWLRLMDRLSRLRTEDRDAIVRFLRLDDWRQRISAVIVMTASPHDSLERERGALPVEGVTGSIMNPEVLEQMRALTLETVQDYKSDFRIHVVDTSSRKLKGKPQRTVETVADLCLDVIEQQLREDIFFAPRPRVQKLFGDRISFDAAGAERVKDLFKRYGKFSPRDQVEPDANSVQALPVVIVRNRSGDILLLQRNEADRSNPLHEKLVIWAGGHVRSEDGVNGEAIRRCAIRELKEELRLSVEADELKLMGSIYVPTGNRTSKHVAIVYEWRAESDDVAVVLSNSEFFERRGNSLSGRFVKISDLVRDVVKKKIDEVWSREIVREFLAPDRKQFPPRLF